ncbi:hypothetical protein AMAG_09139 [Allomyces macrogynus ATCC 38327]|uniref:Uncharacterized protein n=1 Tax=Allomyces macrogynus (strain ATCC 38327) TaxID=578462 RepID=A0A0L0SNI5_ALLM3|nr:hypothetical protein AMAG_09139 [Allomyces macrogynus ATCC 38327]|eukprot:KNE64081.1 hypothetical protein AMAG_09139 [Allomyces macrogynus ATCC 38327]
MPAKQPGERKGRAWGEPDERAMAEAANPTTPGTGGGKRTGDAGGKAKEVTPPKHKKTGKGDVTSRLGPQVVTDSAAAISAGKSTESSPAAEGPSPVDTKDNKGMADVSSMETKADKGTTDALSATKSMEHADSGHAPEPPLAAAVTTAADH